MSLPPEFKPDKATIQWAMEKINDLIAHRRKQRKATDAGANALGVVPLYLYQQFLKATRQTTRKAPTDA